MKGIDASAAATPESLHPDGGPLLTYWSRRGAAITNEMDANKKNAKLVVRGDPPAADHEVKVR